MAGPIAGSRKAKTTTGVGPLSGARKAPASGGGIDPPISQSDVTGLTAALEDRPTNAELNQALEDVPVWSTNQW